MSHIARDPTKLDAAAAGLLVPGTADGVDPALNERWLLHGTKPSAVLPILAGGFNERVTSLKGIFGAGVYLVQPLLCDQGLEGF